jgi:glycosyltransferase involved in cell wall biosynthesis
MRIAIDARWIFTEISGIGAHTQALIRELARTDRSNEYVLLFHNPSVMERTLDAANLRSARHVSTRILPHKVFSVRNQLLLPRWLRAERIDIFHSTNYMIPLLAFPRHRRGRTACVTTIHDVIPMIFPDHAPKSRKSRIYPLFRRVMIEVGARADAVITVSEASRRDVLHHLRIKPAHADKVRVVYNGVSQAFHPPVDPRPRKDGNRSRTVLYVGRADPYKNLPVLIDAFARLRDRLPFPLRLTICGSPDPRYPEPLQRIRERGLRESVKWTGYLPEEDLVHYYQQADVLAHPSRYEGFGLQIVEAMACGLPVVTSRGGSLEEVADDAALLVHPDDTEGFANRIEEVLTRPELAEELSRKGLERARNFTWERAAEETVAVYRSLADRESRGAKGNRPPPPSTLHPSPSTR